MRGQGDPPILILTGPPGVGKTTVAERLARGAPRAVHLESDLFFRQIRSGYVAPWKPESDEQNRTVFRIVAQAAAEYAEAGYFTIVEGIVIPGWFFEPLRDALREAGHPVAYAILRAPLPVCASRAGGRAREPLEDPEAVERLWRSFADLEGFERHVLELGDEPPEAVSSVLAERLAAGLLSV